MPCECGDTACTCYQFCVCDFERCCCMRCGTMRAKQFESGNINVNLKHGKTFGKIPVRTASSHAAASSSSKSKRLPSVSKSVITDHRQVGSGASSSQPDQLKRKLGSTPDMKVSESSSNDDPHATIKRKLSEPCKYPISEKLLAEIHRSFSNRSASNLGESSLSSVNNNQRFPTESIVTDRRQVGSGPTSLLRDQLRRNLSSSDMKASESSSNADPHATIKRQLSEPCKFCVDENWLSGLHPPVSNRSTFNHGESSSKDDNAEATSFPSNETDNSAVNFEYLKKCSDRAKPSYKAFDSQLRTPSTNEDRNENFGLQTSSSQFQNTRVVPGDQSSLDFRHQSRITLSATHESHLPHPSNSTISELIPSQPSQEHPLNLSKKSTDDKHKESTLHCSSFLLQNTAQIPVQHPRMDLTDHSNTLTSESVEPASSAEDESHPIIRKLLSSESSAEISYSDMCTESATPATQSSAAHTSFEPIITSIRCSVIRGPSSQLSSRTLSSNICTPLRGVNEGENVSTGARIQEFYNPMQPTISSAHHETNPPNLTFSSVRCSQESSSFSSSATSVGEDINFALQPSLEIQNPNQAPVTHSASYDSNVIPEPAMPPSTQTESTFSASLELARLPSRDPTYPQSSVFRSALQAHRTIGSDFNMMEDTSMPSSTESAAFFLTSQDPNPSCRTEEESTENSSSNTDERMETD